MHTLDAGFHDGLIKDMIAVGCILSRVDMLSMEVERDGVL